MLNCCGNLICEADESGICGQDCGPKTITTSSLGCVGSCYTSNVLQVNVRATNEITVQALSFNILPDGKASHNITVSTANGKYEDASDDDWNITVASEIITFTGELYF